MIARLGQSDYIKNLPIGSVTEGVAMHAGRPLFIVNPHISLNIVTRELDPGEFPLPKRYGSVHQQKADPATDRVFGVFTENTLVAAARCRRHPDGLEVDAVYTPPVPWPGICPAGCPEPGRVLRERTAVHAFDP